MKIYELSEMSRQALVNILFCETAVQLVLRIAPTCTPHRLDLYSASRSLVLRIARMATPEENDPQRAELLQVDAAHSICRLSNRDRRASRTWSRRTAPQHGFGSPRVRRQPAAGLVCIWLRGTDDRPTGTATWP